MLLVCSHLDLLQIITSVFKTTILRRIHLIKKTVDNKYLLTLPNNRLTTEKFEWFEEHIFFISFTLIRS